MVMAQAPQRPAFGASMEEHRYWRDSQRLRLVQGDAGTLSVPTTSWNHTPEQVCRQDNRSPRDDTLQYSSQSTDIDGVLKVEKDTDFGKRGGTTKHKTPTMKMDRP